MALLDPMRDVYIYIQSGARTCGDEENKGRRWYYDKSTREAKSGG